MIEIQSRRKVRQIAARRRLLCRLCRTCGI